MFTSDVTNKVGILARKLDVEPAALLAVAEVESAGVAFWKVGNKNMPAIRFEGHYFYKRLTGAKRAKAVEQGLANPKMGGVKNPTSYTARYALLERATLIDRQAAYESTSWGLGQVMGAHWKKLGYASVDALVADAKSGVDGQIKVMAAYIQKFGLVDELQEKGWLDFALQYNGPAARKMRYPQKIEAAYKRYSKGEGAVASTDSVVADWQKDLKTLGYYQGKIDGIVGTKTKSALRKFQADNGLVVDGKVGPNTRDALDRAIAKKAVQGADSGVKQGSALTGTGVAIETVNQASDAVQSTVPQLQSISDYLSSPLLQGVIVALIVGGLGLTLWSMFKRNKANKELEA